MAVLSMIVQPSVGYPDYPLLPSTLLVVRNAKGFVVTMIPSRINQQKQKFCSLKCLFSNQAKYTDLHIFSWIT